MPATADPLRTTSGSRHRPEAYGTTRLVTKEIERGNAARGQNRGGGREYPYGAMKCHREQGEGHRPKSTAARPTGAIARHRNRSAAAAPTATAATTAAGRPRCGRAATSGDGDCGQQLDGVGVPLRAGRRVGGRTHRTTHLERGAARAAPELITRHPTSVGPVRPGAHGEFGEALPDRCAGVVHRRPASLPRVVSGG